MKKNSPTHHLNPLKIRVIAVLAIVAAVLPILVFPGKTFAGQPQALPRSPEKANYIAALNHLYELWSYYKYTYIKNGRVISLDENNITTSEGQGYAMLRAVWADDHQTFKEVFQWTRTHLKRAHDHLFAWKYRHDQNAAADADCDIALALILAAEKFSTPAYKADALTIIHDIWEKEVIRIKDRYFLTAGNWAPGEKYPTIHVAYLAPYIYELFAALDTEHPWQALIRSSYDIWEWIYLRKKFALAPEILFIDKTTGAYLIEKPHAKGHPPVRFSYDAFPLFFRAAVDEIWFGRGHRDLRLAMLAFFQKTWREQHNFMDRYTLSGTPLSRCEGLPLYATVQALASIDDPELAAAIDDQKLVPLWKKAVTGKDTPYYLHNWLWFGRALVNQVARDHTNFFDFLKPFDGKRFFANFPWHLLAVVVLLYLATRFIHFRYDGPLRWAFLACGFAICARYLWWRLNASLNFLESMGPFISITLLIAEIYCVSTVLLLLVQVGIHAKNKRRPLNQVDYEPWVDIYIPIYSESLAILEKTLLAATAIRYAPKKVYILDDSHRRAVEQLAAQYGATYLKGPKKHAKAGNLNHALPQTQGELIVVFDTDHIPVDTFLSETVPFFSDPQVGVVQTPHHFYNQDVFQRAFLCNSRVPNEQDMFNHGIQGARDNWQGAFFVGSGAVFRRRALEKTGGFKLMSVTEDIHTSQHLHANGFTSVFVDKDLAVGLTAESFSAYIIQRRRWMQGCLQIFFKNNPLFQKGLGIRHRLGYLASLYYFFFPIARVIFWITPLYYLLFHLHPLFADVAVLLAYMVPYLICLPLLSSALLDKWPRMCWGVTYENAVCFPLFLSMFSLLLPGKLGFAVTPKGIVSGRRRFDFSSSAVTLAATAVTLAAILKGLWEYQYFHIEKEAYFFNIAWATYNLLFLLSALLVAWERPQKRTEERLNSAIPFTLTFPDGKENYGPLSGKINDISLSGASLFLSTPVELPRKAILTLFYDRELSLPVTIVYQDRKYFSRIRCGLHFDTLAPRTQQALFLRTFASHRTWAQAHSSHTKSNVLMIFYFIKGIACCFLPSLGLKRHAVRHPALKKAGLQRNGRTISAILRNRSATGMQLILFAKTVGASGKWAFLDAQGKCLDIEMIYLKQKFPFVFQAGFQIPPASGNSSGAYGR